MLGLLSKYSCCVEAVNISFTTNDSLTSLTRNFTPRAQLLPKWEMPSYGNFFYFCVVIFFSPKALEGSMLWRQRPCWPLHLDLLALWAICCFGLQKLDFLECFMNNASGIIHLKKSFDKTFQITVIKQQWLPWNFLRLPWTNGEFFSLIKVKNKSLLWTIIIKKQVSPLTWPIHQHWDIVAVNRSALRQCGMCKQPEHQNGPFHSSHSCVIHRIMCCRLWNSPTVTWGFSSAPLVHHSFYFHVTCSNPSTAGRAADMAQKDVNLI